MDIHTPTQPSILILPITQTLQNGPLMDILLPTSGKPALMQLLPQNGSPTIIQSPPANGPSKTCTSQATKKHVTPHPRTHSSVGSQNHGQSQNYHTESKKVQETVYITDSREKKSKLEEKNQKSKTGISVINGTKKI